MFLSQLWTASFKPIPIKDLFLFATKFFRPLPLQTESLAIYSHFGWVFGDLDRDPFRYLKSDFQFLNNNHSNFQHLYRSYKLNGGSAKIGDPQNSLNDRTPHSEESKLINYTISLILFIQFLNYFFKFQITVAWNKSSDNIVLWKSHLLLRWKSSFLAAKILSSPA